MTPANDASAYSPETVEGDHLVQEEAKTLSLARAFALRIKVGDVVLLSGPLGAGKTTFVRGLLSALGHRGPVRSPTFNLIQTFATVPPICHADLYRVASHAGLGLEEYMETHAVLIEWPDRAVGLVHPEYAWRVEIDFEGESRRIRIRAPR